MKPGKYKMPENFYERVLDYERQIDTLKHKTPEHLLKSLTNLYSDAIEYHGYLDNSQKCQELQMRMQSILVRPYVLDCLSRYENEAKEKQPPAPKLKPGFFAQREKEADLRRQEEEE